MDYQKIYNQHKEETLAGRYIHLDHIEPLLSVFSQENKLQTIGKSVQGKPIYGLELGHGKTKILIWSQMHGNESTTTKAIFDLFNLLNSKNEMAQNLLKSFTYYFIPMLNPDGAKLYTRENANQIDLNRDAQNQTQPESAVLMKIYNQFCPDFCYNMHDQRTIFGVGETNKPATVSFLAPSYNQERDINFSRNKAINVIVAMNKVLQRYIPGQIGRFDDDFNLNCVGDTFQSLKTPTILFESGHFQGDYSREKTREYIFIALLSSFYAVNENDLTKNQISDYMNIPQNNTRFFDFVYKNIKINYDNSEIITNFAIQYKEELIDNTILFKAYLSKIGDLSGDFGHFEFDAEKKMYSDDFENNPKVGQKANFYLDKNIEIFNGMIK